MAKRARVSVREKKTLCRRFGTCEQGWGGLSSITVINQFFTDFFRFVGSSGSILFFFVVAYFDDFLMEIG